MKKLLITLIILVAVYLGWNTIQPKPDMSVPEAVVSETVENTENNSETPINNLGKTVDNANVKVSFKGFGPGKLHNGSFSGINSKFSFDTKGDLSGTVVVDVASLTTDTEGVTKHLKTDAFFDVAKYPTATFKLNSLVGLDAQGAQASGLFTIHGVTKTVTFPVKSSSTGFIATFNLNLKDFGINQTFANETVEISVVVPIK
jgi:polyisoprenoid-binding protein YceI